MSDNNQKKLLVALSGEMQAVEDMFQQLYSQRSIDTAEGAQLDLLGKIVGQARGGLVDDDYRRLIRARISVNRSKGTVADVIKVARLVVDNDAIYYQVDNQGVATVVIRFLGDSVSDEVAALAISYLRDTVSGGVRIIVEYSTDWDNVLIWGEGNWNDKNWAASPDNSV